MAKCANFALRLPPEMKAAAEALKRVHVYRPSRSGKRGATGSVDTSSINETFCSLILEGLEPMLGYVQKALDEETKEHAGWQEIMKFLLDTPTATVAKEIDFPEGPMARKLIDERQDYDGPDGCPDGELVGLGIDREHAAREYAWSQKKLLDLTGAKGAIMNVLGPLEARAKETREESMARIEKEGAERKAEREKEMAKRAAEKEMKNRPSLSVVH
jgi:hypothetical protein